FHAAKRLVLATEADPTPVKDKVESVVVEYEDFVMARIVAKPSVAAAQLARLATMSEDMEIIT
nr:peroxisome biogenesis protein 6 [Tanacetum cinerariifolium]